MTGQVDVWAAGVCLYVWVWGCLPFQGDSIPDMFTAIKEKPLTFPPYPDCHPHLKDLITKASHSLSPLTLTATPTSNTLSQRPAMHPTACSLLAHDTSRLTQLWRQCSIPCATSNLTVTISMACMACMAAIQCLHVMKDRALCQPLKVVQLIPKA